MMQWIFKTKFLAYFDINLKKRKLYLLSHRMFPDKKPWNPEIWKNFVCVQQPTYQNKKELEEETSKVAIINNNFY